MSSIESRVVRSALSFVTVMLFAACDVPPLEDDTADTQSLTANPCTAVALVSPASGFSIVSGVPLALSASANCPVGQTPEFSYWHKRVGDANWAIGAYVPGESTFTAPDVGDWCIEVAARAIGSTDSFQVRTGAACGEVVTDATSATTTRTMQLPLALLFGGFPAAPSGIPFSGNGNGVVIGIGADLGETIIGVRAHVIDSLIGPTSVQLQLQSVTNGLMSIRGVSPLSSGTGLPQTIAVGSVSVPVESSTSYFAFVGFPFGGGTATSRVDSVEVDLVSPQG